MGYQANYLMCNKNYVGQTQRLFSTRRAEYHDNFFQSQNNYKVISKHKLHNSGRDFEWKNMKILHKERNYRKLSLAEMFYIKKQKENFINKMTDLKFFPPSYTSLVHCKNRFVNLPL